MPKSCFWSHNWTKWGEVLVMEGKKYIVGHYTVTYPESELQSGIPFTRHIQERTCETCGIVQRRKVET